MILKKVFIPLLLGLSPIFLFLAIHPTTAIASPNTTQNIYKQPHLEEAVQPLGTTPVLTKTAVIPTSKDAFISHMTPDNNAGNSTHVSAGRSGPNGSTIRRGLIAFDIASNIPMSATILTASFSVDVVGIPTGGGVDSTFGLHQLTTDWIEGAKTGNSGAAATAGEVSWNSAKHLTTTWTTAGGDFTVTTSSNTAVTGLGSYTWNSTNDMVANVQGWLDSPATNYGWLLKSDDEISSRTARRFGSQEGGSPAMLTVTYSIPPAYFNYLPIVLTDK